MTRSSGTAHGYLIGGAKALFAAGTTVFAIGVLFPLPTRLAVLWAVGRASGCSFRDALASRATLQSVEDIGNQLEAATRVIQEDPSGLQLFDTPRGRYWSIPNDKFLKYTIAEEEIHVYGTGDQGVRPGDVVFDCGANVGVFTRMALAGRPRLVVSIEPTPTSVECLRRNFQQEIAEGRVIVVPKGVWNRDDMLELALGPPGDSTGNSVVLGRHAKNKIKVPLTTIDHLVRELGLNRVDFIKMDIEGAEKQALWGAAETIRKFRPRMAISSEHLPDDVEKIPQVVRAIWPGYKIRFTDCTDRLYQVKPEVLLFVAGSPREGG